MSMTRPPFFTGLQIFPLFQLQVKPWVKGEMRVLWVVEFLSEFSKVVQFLQQYHTIIKGYFDILQIERMVSHQKLGTLFSRKKGKKKMIEIENERVVCKCCSPNWIYIQEIIFRKMNLTFGLITLNTENSNFLFLYPIMAV